jgi:hypothetical protein
LLQAILALATALGDIITKVPQVVTALTNLKTFLDTV